MLFVTLNYNGLEQSLADWGVQASGCNITLANLASDTLRLAVPRANYTDDPIWPFEAPIVLHITAKPRGHTIYHYFKYSAQCVTFCSRAIDLVAHKPRTVRVNTSNRRLFRKHSYLLITQIILTRFNVAYSNYVADYVNPKFC